MGLPSVETSSFAADFLLGMSEKPCKPLLRESLPGTLQEKARLFQPNMLI